MGMGTVKYSYILAVRYETERRHISHVKAQGGTVFGVLESLPCETLTKSEILSQIDRGDQVYTMVENNIGAKVIWRKINGTRYLKTVPNDIEEDNLGELPTF